MTGNRSTRIVTESDCKFFEALATARLFDREQASEVTGRRNVSVSTCNAWLLKLVRAGLLKRFFIATEGRGIKSLYCLTPLSAGIAHCEYRPIPRPADSVLTSEPFVLHQLAVNAIFVQLKYRPAPSKNIKLVRWLTFNEPISTATQLMPDGYFELNCMGEVHPMFCEIDRGTESQKIWIAKTNLYLKFASSGEFQQLFHQERFRVLVIAETERRASQIRQTVARQTSKIFWFSTLNVINRQGLFAPHWLRPEGSDSLSLL